MYYDMMEVLELLDLFTERYNDIQLLYRPVFGWSLCLAKPIDETWPIGYCTGTNVEIAVRGAVEQLTHPGRHLL